LFRNHVYSFGIIMYLIATGEPPFRDRKFGRDLICDIMGGLRPSMPDSAPEEYKKLAERCCDAYPDKRPDALTLWDDIGNLIDKDNSDDNTWNAVYHNDVKPLSRLEKERVNILVFSYLLENYLNQEIPTIWIQLQVWLHVDIQITSIYNINTVHFL